MGSNVEQLKSACENGDLRGARDLLNTPWGRDFCEQGQLDTLTFPPSEDRLLHVASSCGQHELVRLLLDRGATVIVVNNRRRAALHLACKNGHAKVIELLLKRQGHLDINTPDDDETTPLHYAALSNHSETVDKLAKHTFRTPQDCLKINAAKSDGSTAMHLAARAGCKETVLGLVDIHANVDCIDEEGCTPLHYACANGHEQCVRSLLSAEADHNVPDNEGKTPMQRAIENGHHQFRNILPR